MKIASVILAVCVSAASYAGQAGYASAGDVDLIAPAHRHEFRYDRTLAPIALAAPEGKIDAHRWHAPRFTLKADGAAPIEDASITWQNQDASVSDTLPVPFITVQGDETYIPSDVYQSLEQYILANATAASVAPFKFTATVSWKLPTPGTQAFVVTAQIVDAKAQAPAKGAFVNFVVEGRP